MINTVIFDMDGVISDTQKVHAQVASELMAKQGATISPEDVTLRFAGIKTADCFRTIFEEHNITTENLPAILEENWKRMISLAKTNVDAIPGAIEFISDLAENDFKLGVASSPSDYVDAVLTRLNVIDLFGSITSGQEVKKGKPEPDIFLLAAEKLSSKPRDCLVIEDSISGTIAARRAGMVCVALLNISDEPSGSPADYTITSITELTIEKIRTYPPIAQV